MACTASSWVRVCGSSDRGGRAQESGVEQASHRHLGKVALVDQRPGCSGERNPERVAAPDLVGPLECVRGEAAATHEGVGDGACS